MAETTIKSSVGTTKTEKRYLSDRIDVQSARTKLFNANSKLSNAQRFFKGVSSNDKFYQKYADEVKKAQAEVDAAKVELSRIESIAKAEYQKAFAKVEKKKTEKESAQIDSQIQSAQTVLQRLKDSGQSTAQQEAVIKDLLDKKNKTGKYAPKVEAGAVVGEQDAQKRPTIDYVALINSAGKYVKDIKPKDRRALAESLQKAGFYRGPVLDIYTDELVQAYQTALAGNQARSALLGEDIPWGQFLQDKITETAALGLATGKGGLRAPTGTVSISTPIEARAKVEAIFKSELGRMPTPDELDKYSNDLIARERKASSITKATQKNVGGVIVTEYTGGLDRDQFLQEQIRKLPEYDKRKADARKLTIQDLAKTAVANGFDLMKDFGSIVDTWTKRVENGEDVDIFKNAIRQTAKLGLPDKVGALLDQGIDLDTVYSPYRRIMATTLEINPDSIQLDDPVLRSAIGPDREMTTFDFKRALRKDARWQYTDQAREEVSNAALGILRDFGFTG